VRGATWGLAACARARLRFGRRTLARSCWLARSNMERRREATTRKRAEEKGDPLVWSEGTPSRHVGAGTGLPPYHICAGTGLAAFAERTQQVKAAAKAIASRKRAALQALVHAPPFHVALPSAQARLTRWTLAFDRAWQARDSRYG
jgi:hypothetical protein